MRVALIDDGVNTSIFPDVRVAHDLHVGEDGIIRERKPNETILTDHGTTIAKIISKYAPSAQYSSLRIFSTDKLNANCVQLKTALEWCLEQRVPIVHMSIGTSLTADYSAIRPVAAKLINNRQAIIAARSNDNHFSLPACLAGVLGVIADAAMEGDAYEVSTLSGHPVIHASSRHEIEYSPDIKYTTQHSNSYAAPTVTAAIHNILEQQAAFSLSIPQVYRLLSKSSDMLPWNKPDFIDDSCILNPFQYPILWNRLFFKCIHESSDIEEALHISDKASSLVYLADTGEGCANSHHNRLNRLFDAYESILYCGIPDDAVLGKQGAKLFWSESCGNNIQASPDTAFIPECPVISFFGESLNTVDALCQLRDVLLDDGYQCACISDYPFSYLYGLDYLSDATDLSAAISHACDLYSPDIILKHISKDCGDGLCNPDEYIVLVGSETAEYAVRKRSTVAGSMQMQRGFTEGDIRMLFEDIQKTYS